MSNTPLTMPAVHPDARPAIGQLLLTLNVGGAEVLASRLARSLVDRYRFVFLCLESLGTIGTSLAAEGFEVHLIGKRSGIDGRCIRTLSRLARGLGLDLLHAHQYPAFFYANAARGLRLRYPILFTEHGRSYPDRRSTKRLVFNRFALRSCDRVVAVGADVRRALIENEGLPAHRVEVLRNGMSICAVADPVSARSAIRQELDIPDRDTVILQVARLDPLKDHRTALRSLKAVAQQRSDVKLLLAGDGAEMPALRRFAEELGVAQMVRFLGLRTDVPRLLASADLFLLTSISEGIPLAVIEAMAAQLPVVATAVGGVPEVVVDGETGLLAPAGDADEVARSLLRLITAPELRRSFGNAGHRRATHLFSEHQMHASYDRLYRSMTRRAHERSTPV